MNSPARDFPRGVRINKIRCHERRDGIADVSDLLLQAGCEFMTKPEGEAGYDQT